MDLEKFLAALLDEVLNLNGRAQEFTEKSALAGAVPELDSIGVVALLTALEERLGVVVEDGEIDGSVFATFGSLIAFIGRKLDAAG